MSICVYIPLVPTPTSVALPTTAYCHPSQKAWGTVPMNPDVLGQETYEL